MLFAFLAASAMVAVGLADPGDGEKLRFNAADQAAARAGTLRRSDHPGAGWIGGPTKPDLSGPTSCPNYPLDLSAFVKTGAAASDWTRAPLVVVNQGEVLQTARMVQEEWRIQVQQPRAIACLASQFDKELATGGGKVISFKRIPFPRLAPYSAAFRLVARQSGALIAFELAWVARSRTQIWVNVGGPATEQAAIHAAAVRYARILAGRIKA